jgi:hypothetical protein
MVSDSKNDGNTVVNSYPGALTGEVNYETKDGRVYNTERDRFRLVHESGGPFGQSKVVTYGI